MYSVWRLWVSVFSWSVISNTMARYHYQLLPGINYYKSIFASLARSGYSGLCLDVQCRPAAFVLEVVLTGGVFTWNPCNVCCLYTCVIDVRYCYQLYIVWTMFVLNKRQQKTCRAEHWSNSGLHDPGVRSDPGVESLHSPARPPRRLRNSCVDS